MWEPLLDKLAKAGFRAVAFDQRGYSPGARPFRVNSYSSGRLAADVIAVATAVGFDRFHVVGHDFGGAIAWIAADRFPREIISVTSLSTPHPEALAEALDDLRAQRLKSSYALLYRIPVLPELVLGFNRAAYLQRLKWQFHPPEQIEEYKQVFSEPGALRGALNWYRAFRFQSHDPLGKIRQPTLFIWGNEDGAFGRVAAEKTADYVEGPFRFHRAEGWPSADVGGARARGERGVIASANLVAGIRAVEVGAGERASRRRFAMRPIETKLPEHLGHTEWECR